jgi:hypothetical protein
MSETQKRTKRQFQAARRSAIAHVKAHGGGVLFGLADSDPRGCRDCDGAADFIVVTRDGEDAWCGGCRAMALARSASLVLNWRLVKGGAK